MKASMFDEMHLVEMNETELTLVDGGDGFWSSLGTAIGNTIGQSIVNYVTSLVDDYNYLMGGGLLSNL